MKNNWIKIAGAAVAALAVTASLHAAPITGGVAIGGDYTSDATGGNLMTATTITTIPGTFTASDLSGTFASGTITDITFASPITVNPAGNLVPNKVLWTLKIGTTTYTFTVNSETQTVDVPTDLSLTGAGTFSDNAGDASVAGTYTLGFTATGGTFSFSGDNQVNVPDGGTTAMLLGGALMGLGLLKRKLMA